MLKRFFQVSALFALCVLLVYAPEIYSSVSGPDIVSTPNRILLRIVLSTQDASASSSFYKALTVYQKAHPSVHLRVTRADAEQLATLSAPLPDVYLFEEGVSLSYQSLFLPLATSPGDNDASSSSAWDDVCYTLPYSPAQGGTLLCAVSTQAREAATALDFINYLHSSSPNTAP